MERRNNNWANAAPILYLVTMIGLFGMLFWATKDYFDYEQFMKQLRGVSIRCWNMAYVLLMTVFFGPKLVRFIRRFFH